MRQRLLSGTALGLAVVLGTAGPATADCSTPGDDSGQNISCAGPFANPYVYNAGDGDDVLFVNSDVADAAGSSVTLFGDTGNDVLDNLSQTFGNAGAATFDGGLGDDVASFTDGAALGAAAGGSGLLFGGSGADVVNASTFSDFAADGRALVSGGSGDDALTLASGSRFGVRGTATFDGGAGDDLLSLSDAAKLGAESFGSATYIGGGGEDTLFADGSAYADYGTNNGQIADYGDALIDGGEGDDLVWLTESKFARFGHATILGGSGTDVARFESGSNFSAGQYATASLYGGSGADTAYFSESNLAMQGGIPDGAAVHGDEGDDTLWLTDDSQFGYYGAASHYGGDGADLLHLDTGAIAGYQGTATLFGGSGDDSYLLSDTAVIAGSGEASLYGGSGGDLWHLAGDTDVAVSAIGVALIAGNQGNDTLLMTDRSDLGVLGKVTQFGDSGDDTLFMQSSSDVADAAGALVTLFGGSGADSYDFSSYSYLAVNGAATLSGDGGADRFSFRDNGGAAAGILGVASILGGGGSDTLLLQDASFAIAGQASFDGGTGDDTLFGLDDANLAFGGKAVVSGGGGSDLIEISGTAADIAAAAGSQATLYGGSGDDRFLLSGGALGNEGTASLYGGSGADLYSFNGARVAVGLASNVTIDGGSGADRAVFAGGAVFGLEGQARLSAGSGNDTLSFADATLDLGGGARVDAGVGDDTLALTDQTVLGTGNLLDGGAGSDRLMLGGDDTGTADAALLGTVTGIEALDKIDGGIWVWQQNFSFTGDGALQQGYLRLADITLGFGQGFSIASGARLEGNGTLAGNVTNAGAIAPGDSSLGYALGTLTVDGALAGGGFLVLEVAFGGPGDLLRVTGPVSGTTQIFFSDLVGLGGAGQQLLVEVGSAGGDSESDAFTLFGGPIETTLYTYDIALLDDGNWYLQSAQNWDQGEFPVAAASTLLTWQAGVAGLHQRLDQATQQVIRQAPQSAALGAGDLQEAVRASTAAQPFGAWVLASGEERTLDRSAGQAFTQDTTSVMAGFDVGFRDLLAGGDLLLAGAFGHIVNAEADLHDSASSYELGGGGGGLYAAWRLQGFDVSAVLKLDSITIDQSTPSVGFAAEYDALAFGGSLAAGWRLDLGSAAWIRPGAQLAYARAWIDGFEDPGGEEVEFDDSDSLTGRLALQAGTSFKLAGATFEPYASVGVAHEFLGESSVTVAATQERIDLGGTALEAGGGLVVRDIADHLSLSLDGAYATGDQGESVSVAVSVRVAW